MVLQRTAMVADLATSQCLLVALVLVLEFGLFGCSGALVDDPLEGASVDWAGLIKLRNGELGRSRTRWANLNHGTRPSHMSPETSNHFRDATGPTALCLGIA